MSRFLLQMAGMPGSGKTTLAGAVARETGALILDKDVIQSAALRAGAKSDRAGGLAYEVLFDLAAELASYGHSVIVDSAAYFPLIIEKGRRIADANGAAYRLVECVCPSGELRSRLATREARASQWTSLLDIDMAARPGAAPLSLAHLIVDTTQPLETYLSKCLEYLEGD